MTRFAAHRSVDICIVHDASDIEAARFLARHLRRSGAVSVLSAHPADVNSSGLKSLRGLGARLASVEQDLARADRLVIIGVNAAGGAVGKALAAFLLGQDVPVEAVYSIFATSDSACGPTIRDAFPDIDLEDSQPCWNGQEDLRRIKRIDETTLAECCQRLQDEIEALAESPVFQVGPSMLLSLLPCANGAADVFCIPGAGASVLSFIDLAQVVPAGFSVLGLQPRGLDAHDPPFTSVEAAATVFAQLIAEHGTGKPFHLVGHSYGGCIAVELASRLHAKGTPPASLTLIDTRPPRDSKWPVDMDDAEVALGWIRLSELAAQRSLGIDERQLRTNDLTFNLRLVQDGMIAAGLLRPNVNGESLVGPMRMFAACVRHWYRPSSAYAGPLRLIYLDDPRRSDGDNAAIAREVHEGWRKHAPNLTFRHGPGNHITGLKSPYAEELIKLMGWESTLSFA